MEWAAKTEVKLFLWNESWAQSKEQEKDASFSGYWKEPLMYLESLIHRLEIGKVSPEFTRNSKVSPEFNDRLRKPGKRKLCKLNTAIRDYHEYANKT